MGKRLSAAWLWIVMALLGALAVPVVTFVILQWVFIPVWGRYGYWVWVNGGSSSGSW
jgi:hypothetical protein